MALHKTFRLSLMSKESEVKESEQIIIIISSNFKDYLRDPKV